ncbi:MAG: hypothetical protein O2960_11035 [Verrucomicrobia bacterium]|nr:hypothetical protein [Verrucomicrobiota bacterium]
MAMRAGLVALATHIDLQCLELPPPQSQAVFGQFGFKTIHVSGDENAGIARIFQNSEWQLQSNAAERDGQHFHAAKECRGVRKRTIRLARASAILYDSRA